MTSSPTPSFTVRAVLWDMDGTLMDSQPFWDEAFIHHCQALGGDPRPELVAQMTGASIRQARELIAATGATRSWDDPATQEVFEAIAHDVEASVSAAPPLLPGALRITSALAEVGLAQAIVSASPRRIVERVASALGDVFAVLVTGEGAWHATAPKVPVVSTVGAGDSSVAGYVLADVRGGDEAERLRTAMIYGSAAASLPGTTLPSPSDLPAQGPVVTRLV